MKNLEKFIKESLNNMLTFKDGELHRSDGYVKVSDRDRLTALEIVACKKLFNESTPGTLSYKYHYLSTGQPEGVLVTCSHSGKTYLVTHQGRIIDFKG